MKTTTSLTAFFLSLLRPHKWWVTGLVVTGLYWSINNSLSPYVLKLIIDKAVSLQHNKAEIWQAILPLGLLYIGLWVIINLDLRFLDFIRLKLFPKIRHEIVKKMFSYLNRHSHSYFQNNFAGSLSNKISDMISGFTEIYTILDEAFVQSISILVAIGMMYFVNPIFSYILIGWTVAFILITIYYIRPVQKLAYIFATSKTALMGKIVDSVSNVSNVRLFSANNYENELISNATIDTVNKDRKMQWYILKMRILWDASIVILIMLELYALVDMYSKNKVSIGDFTFILSLSIAIFSNLWYLASQFVSFAEQVGRCKQALTVMAQPHAITDRSNAPDLEVKKGKIEFDNVSFHYDAGTHLFKNKNILIKPGQKIGLVGTSGSGKTTFVNLILRLFDVESGSIKIDNQDIRKVSQSSLRQNITMIAQDITLFHRTLMDNIRYGKIDANDKEVIAASKKAHCHEFVTKLPRKYKTMVGERGIKLSGGQRQRIAIARAMLKNAPILILDEATSALDSVTEKHIQDSLHTLMQGRTTIVIAHRLSTLSEMDRILVFDQGRIVEDGTHEALLNANGHYARLWSLQAGGFLLDD